MPLKEQRPWYENALLLTVAGSIIVVVGQLAGTIIPIMYGPADISDYSISAIPIYISKNLSEKETWDEYILDTRLAYADVRVDDFHSFIRPYRFGVYLKAINLPKEVLKVSFDPIEVKAGSASRMRLYLEDTDSLFSHPIKIQGIGGDGKIRNLTIYLTIFGQTSVSSGNILGNISILPKQ
jgi:hypothetical protein